jgi:hypothetical protein
MHVRTGSRILSALLALAIATSAAALTPAEYGVARQKADAQYKLEREKCKSLSGNARDVCVKDAKAVRDSAQADAYAAFKGTPEARAEAAEDKAEAHYRVARQRCEPLGGDDGARVSGARARPGGRQRDPRSGQSEKRPPARALRGAERRDTRALRRRPACK